MPNPCKWDRATPPPVPPVGAATAPLKSWKSLKSPKTQLSWNPCRSRKSTKSPKTRVLNSSFRLLKTSPDEKLELAHQNTSQTIQKHVGNALADPRIDILSRTFFNWRYFFREISSLAPILWQCPCICQDSRGTLGVWARHFASQKHLQTKSWN